MAILLFIAFYARKHIQSTRYRANIHAINSYKEVAHLFNTCDKNTLITFDVDDTLITGRDALARNFWNHTWFKVQAFFKYPELIYRDTYEWATSIMFDQAERFVIEPFVIDFIQKLQTQGCIILGLTLMDTGSWGIINSMPAWRVKMLHEFGIDFNSINSKHRFHDAIFTTIPIYRDTYPGIYSNIICTNQQSKGLVLGTFLDYFKITLRTIISFDDNKQALESIADMCAQRGILFTGYHYKGAELVAPKWDTNRALRQVDYIMQKGKWMSDYE